MGLGDEFGSTSPGTIEEGRTMYDDVSTADDVYEEYRDLVSFYEGYDAVLDDAFAGNETYSTMDAYEVVADHLAGTEYSAAAVRMFCEREDIAPAEGWLVSAMVNEAADDEVTLPGMDDVDWVGMRNEKRLTVRGDVGRWAGCEMQGGVLGVEGDAGRYTGNSMEGGVLEVEGDIGRGVGQDAEGGSIYVNEEPDLGLDIDCKVYMRRGNGVTLLYPAVNEVKG
jgi:hypothetical protein